MIKLVKQVSIPVRNQDQSLEFYTKKLGFSVVVDVDFGWNQRWIELKLPEGDTQIVLFTPKEQEQSIGTFSPIMFQCDDVKKTYEDLSNKGVEFTRVPTQESWGTYALLKDIDGNVFCLSSQ